MSDGKALTPFSASGRVDPEGWESGEGGYAFVLGSDTTGVHQKLRVGDFIEITQRGDLLTGTPAQFVRWRAHYRSAPTPPGLLWVFRADRGSEGAGASPSLSRVQHFLTRETDRFDGAIPAGAPPVVLSGVTFRLELQQELYGTQAGNSASIATATATEATLTGLLSMTLDHVGRNIRVYGAFRAANNGTFAITEIVDATSVKVSNTTPGVGGDPNNGSIGWEVLRGQQGTTASITAFASDKVTVTGLVNQDAGAVGRRMTISNAGEFLNNGTFIITDVLSATSVKLHNPSGVGPDAFNGEIDWEVLEFDVELPAVYLDSVHVDTTDAAPGAINRMPHPGEVGVPVDSRIYLELVDSTDAFAAPNNVRLSTVKVYVDEVLAFQGDDDFTGTFQPGFSGLLTTIDSGYGYSIEIVPDASFASLAVVDVRAEAAARGAGLPVLTFDWSFTTEDLIAPTLTAAFAPTHTTVHVTANEALLSVSASGAADALNPDNWTVEVASTDLDSGLPAVPLSVVSVVEIAPTIYELTFDWEMTRGALYRVVATGIEDLFGNPFEDPTNQTTFVGFTCAFPEDRDFQLIDKLPRLNVEEDLTQDLARFVACLQEVLDLQLCEVDRWTDILDPDLAPERFVDAMLADLGNPFTTFVLSAIDKRRLVEVLIAIYRQKGTAAGIINAVRFFLGLEVTIVVPAFDGVWLLGLGALGGIDAISGELEGTTVLGSGGGAARYSFEVHSAVSLTDDQRDKITRIANYMKAGHEHLLGFVEPTLPEIPDHLELGLSELGVNWQLH